VTTTNFYDLSINDIINLAGGNLDDSELATRLVRRLAFDVRARTNRGLSLDEENDFAEVTWVTDKALKGRVC
jgi:hypothetical protein